MTMIPPPEFIHPPNLPVIEYVLRQEDVDAECHRVMPGAFLRDKVARVEGCSLRVDGKCYIWRVDNEAVRVHETAHCNGWPTDHRGGIPDHPWGR